MCNSTEENAIIKAYSHAELLSGLKDLHLTPACYLLIIQEVHLGTENIDLSRVYICLYMSRTAFLVFGVSTQ